MKLDLVAEYNILKNNLLLIKELLNYDILHLNRIQLTLFDSYRSAQQFVNVKKFELILNAFKEDNISQSLIFELEDIMLQIILILNNKEKDIFNYFLHSYYKFAINDEKQFDENLITINNLEQLVNKYNHEHEINALKVYKENQRDYEHYKINYYDYLKTLLENYLEKFQEYSDRKNIFNDEFLEGLLFIIDDYNIFSTNKISILKKTFNLNKVSIKINPKKKIYAFLLIRQIKKYLKENYGKIKYSDQRWEDEIIKLIGMNDKDLKNYKDKGNTRQGKTQSKYWDSLEEYFQNNKIKD